VSERELLAIVYAIEYFNSYVYSRPIDIYTDHKPLVTAKSLKKPMNRLGRLFLKIQDVEYRLFHTPGAVNYLPDFLSRVFKPDIAEVNHVKFVSSVDWIAEQSKYIEISQVIDLVSQGDYREGTWWDLPSGPRWL
jgi:hypothetical protein